MRHEGTSIQRRKEKSTPSCMRERGGEREREREEGFDSSFCVFLFPLGLSYVNWAKHECCLLYLRFSLRSSDLPLFYFQGLSLPGLLATAILDSVGEGEGGMF